MRFTVKDYESLSKDELYDILKLRCEVFVVEQDCPYQDLDGKDESALHILGTDEHNRLNAYCRILPPGMRYEEPCISRVVSAFEVRKEGWGRALMKVAVAETLKAFSSGKIRISAQLYLKKFYEELGFAQVSDVYPEDDIPHIEMLLDMG